MDRMLAEAKRPQIRISSTDIPDHTKKISVGADDMLVNAVNRMNRKSRAYVFIDQARIKDGGIIEFRVDDTDFVGPRPQYYIRGAITQLDSDARQLGVSTGVENDENSEYGLNDVSATIGASVVTVDLHLIAYPSRLVLPGASVSNSMVVRRRGFSSGFFGQIAKRSLGVTLQIDRIESTGQAVRNLVELGVIELLGRHANVPYWECLSSQADNPAKVAMLEQGHVTRPATATIKEAQQLLVDLGLANLTVSGRLDRKTQRALSRFQAEHHLIASGRPDFDTMRLLRKLAATVAAKPVPKLQVLPLQPQTPLSGQPSTVPALEPDGYKSLNYYLLGG